MSDGDRNISLARATPPFHERVRIHLKIQELIFALVPKSGGRVRKLLETRGLHFALVLKSVEATENVALVDFVLTKECANC